ncbi:FkbM family methyltransferase [Caulobacter henricii]|uniref:Methyltransferase FkbM domain-containing protein n=1 Tax=Caulobacter henricii TaxID=69395 RepID=A0A0N7JHM1_9CAUL|nr:FkbM family methyltransferase [Caulobacter henricii]ALL13778.1 hypothetical protein AQ619_10770 [Caulobacter henricii]
MDLSLILVGAHDGSKTQQLVAKACQQGKALLIEPVPWLFEKLKARYSDNPNIILHNSVIAGVEGEVEFYAPLESANEVDETGDQLGSLNPSHAVLHNSEFEQKFQKISVHADTFESLFARFDIGKVKFLVTDTEGHDAVILSQFPFARTKPRQIMFEHKHIDGIHRIGLKFAELLIMLDGAGYRMKILDQENCLAQLMNSEP